MNWLMTLWWKVRGVKPVDYFRNCERCGRKGRDHAGNPFACRRYKRASMYENVD